MQTIRLYKDDLTVEMEWTVGPVPVDDGMGKEIMSKFITNVDSGPEGRNSVYTDSNGREFQHRVLNYRPTWDLQVHEPVAGNFYPITTAMYIKGNTNTNTNTNSNTNSKKTAAQLSVIVDRAQAGASLRSGEMELMVHRRLLADDYRGVDEPLNETVGGMTPYPDWTRIGDGIVVSGKHRFLLSTELLGMKELRSEIDKTYTPFNILVQNDDGNSNSKSMSLGAGLGYDLPINVQLMTMSLKDNGKTLLLRFAHQFAINEDNNLSQPIKINLSKLLKSYNIIHGSLQEWTLSQNELKKEQLKSKIYWTKENNNKNSDDERMSMSSEFKGDSDEDDMTIVLKPMQIKTITVKVQI